MVLECFMFKVLLVIDEFLCSLIQGQPIMMSSMFASRVRVVVTKIEPCKVVLCNGEPGPFRNQFLECIPSRF